MKKKEIKHYSDKEALEFHNSNKSGKIEIIPSKPMTTKRDLALAYSPGVAYPCKEIEKDPDALFKATAKESQAVKFVEGLQETKAVKKAVNN